jgi:hypothetical protein
MELLYTLTQLANHLKISEKSVRNKLNILKIKRYSSKNRNAMYSADVIIVLEKSYVYKYSHKIKNDIKGYTANYLIIESKLNYDTLL